MLSDQYKQFAPHIRALCGPNVTLSSILDEDPRDAAVKEMLATDVKNPSELILVTRGRARNFRLRVASSECIVVHQGVSAEVYLYLSLFQVIKSYLPEVSKRLFLRRFSRESLSLGNFDLALAALHQSILPHTPIFFEQDLDVMLDQLQNNADTLFYLAIKYFPALHEYGHAHSIVGPGHIASAEKRRDQMLDVYLSDPINDAPRERVEMSSRLDPNQLAAEIEADIVAFWKIIEIKNKVAPDASSTLDDIMQLLGYLQGIFQSLAHIEFTRVLAASLQGREHARVDNFGINVSMNIRFDALHDLVLDIINRNLKAEEARSTSEMVRMSFAKHNLTMEMMRAGAISGRYQLYVVPENISSEQITSWAVDIVNWTKQYPSIALKEAPALLELINYGAEHLQLPKEFQALRHVFSNLESL